jgi:hypothetical protein
VSPGNIKVHLDTDSLESILELTEHILLNNSIGGEQYNLLLEKLYNDINNKHSEKGLFKNLLVTASGDISRIPADTDPFLTCSPNNPEEPPKGGPWLTIPPLFVVKIEPFNMEGQVDIDGAVARVVFNKISGNIERYIHDNYNIIEWKISMYEGIVKDTCLDLLHKDKNAKQELDMLVSSGNIISNVSRYWGPGSGHTTYRMRHDHNISVRIAPLRAYVSLASIMFASNLSSYLVCGQKKVPTPVGSKPKKSFVNSLVIETIHLKYGAANVSPMHLLLAKANIRGEMPKNIAGRLFKHWNLDDYHNILNLVYTQLLGAVW